MIARYSTPEMTALWDQQNRFQSMLDVEIQVALEQARLGIIPKVAAVTIKKRARFDIQAIDQLEKELKHDVIAFVQNVASSVGDHGRYFHFGLTSSDVLDTALSLQMKKSFECLLSEIQDLKDILVSLIENHTESVCAGRTHGMWAEPTTFSIKMASFLAELQRNEKRLQQALDTNRVCKLSGAVGTYSFLPPQLESLVASALDLKAETIATQVIPRDRHAEALWSLSMLLCGYERLAVELRHLQRSEVGEVLESFNPGQKGSSAMPHKQNPISAENITGLARMVRSYASGALENIVLWHERDISHSCVERVFLPDAFILSHYATRRMKSLLKSLVIQKERMLWNINQSHGLLMSSHLLLLFIEKGFSREKAYEKIQSLSFQCKKKSCHLQDLLLTDPETQNLISKKELQDLFSGRRHLRHQKELLKNVLKKRKGKV
jgi:adenylosuccinate lyase